MTQLGLPANLQQIEQQIEPVAGRSGTSNLVGLAPLLFPRCCKERILLLLVAYFDDSGTHRASPLVTVGGYWSTAERWAILAEEWQQVLDELRLPFFHMADFENRHGPYRDWPQRRHEYVIRRLIGIIKRHTLGSVSTSLRRVPYDALNRPDRLALGTPQTICAEASMSKLVEKLKRERRDEHIAYVFENGPGWTQVFQRSRSEEWRRGCRAASLTFASKRGNPQLQAADFLAYEAYKDALRHCGFHARQRRKSAESLLKRGNHDSGIYRTADHLRNLVDMVMRAP